MARGELIGLMKCPECGFDDAEVRPDKSGAPYRFCPDCTAQYFTRGGEKAKNLLAKVRRPAQPAASVAAVVPTKVNTTAAPLAPPAKPVRKTFSLGDL